MPLLSGRSVAIALALAQAPALVTIPARGYCMHSKYPNADLVCEALEVGPRLVHQVTASIYVLAPQDSDSTLVSSTSLFFRIRACARGKWAEEMRGKTVWGLLPGFWDTNRNLLEPIRLQHSGIEFLAVNSYILWDT